MTRKFRPDEPDDGVPVRLTPRRMAARLDALALDASRIGLELRRLRKYVDSVPFLDGAELAGDLATNLAELAGAVAIGKVEITVGRDDQVARERYPLFEATPIVSEPIDDLDAFPAEEVKEAEVAKAPEPSAEPEPVARPSGKGKSFDVFACPAGGYREFVGAVRAAGKSAAKDAARLQWPERFRGLADMEIVAVPTPKTPVEREAVYGVPQPEVVDVDDDQAGVSELDIYHGQPPVADALAAFPTCEGYQPTMSTRKGKGKGKGRGKRAATAPAGQEVAGA